MTLRYGILFILMYGCFIFSIHDPLTPAWLTFACALALLYIIVAIIHDELVRLTHPH